MRLFLGLELPPRARERLAEVQERLRPVSSGWRWVAPPAIHLTLRFLGEVDAADDARQRARWRSLARAHDCRAFRIGPLGVLPRGPRPRVLYAGVVASTPVGSLEALARALEAVARDAGFAAEERPFRAHLTVARALRGASPTRPPDAFESLDIEVECSAVTLFRSELSPGGAAYTPLARFPFRPFGLDPGEPPRQHARVTDRSYEP